MFLYVYISLNTITLFHLSIIFKSIQNFNIKRSKTHIYPVLMSHGGRPPIVATRMPPNSLEGGESFLWHGLGCYERGRKRVISGVWLNWVIFNLLLPKVVKSPLIIGFFIRYDWSLDSIWFYTNPRLRKTVIFVNLMQMVKNLDSWVQKSTYVWGRC